MSFSSCAPRLYELAGARQGFGDGQQVRLMRFEEAQQRGEQRGFARLRPQLICPDSGQVEEPLRPPLVAERCRKRGEGKRDRVIWCLRRTA